jgi:hypothetical protein
MISFCHCCGHDYIESKTFPEWNRCFFCMFPYPALEEECVYYAILDEVKSLLNGIEGDFERIAPMNQEAEDECDYALENGYCDVSCAFMETCPYVQDVYRLPD